MSRSISFSRVAAEVTLGGVFPTGMLGEVLFDSVFVSSVKATKLFYGLNWTNTVASIIFIPSQWQPLALTVFRLLAEVLWPAGSPTASR